MMEKVIEVSHLTKEYKNLKAIDDLFVSKEIN